MKPTISNAQNQLNFFPELSFKTNNPPSKSVAEMDGNNQPNIPSSNQNHGRIDHMPKFKPFYKCQKPLIGLSPESFLDYINSVIVEDHLCRLVKQVVLSLDIVAIEEKYSFLGQKMLSTTLSGAKQVK